MQTIQIVGQAVDIAHRACNLHVAAFVHRGDRQREGLERFAPELVDAFLAAVVLHEMPQLERLLEALATLLHQLVVHADRDSHLAEFHDGREQIGGAVEQCAGQHRRIHALACRVGLGLPCRAGAVEFLARGVDAFLGVVEGALGHLVDQQFLLGERVLGGSVVTDPVTVVVDDRLAIEDIQCPVLDCFVHRVRAQTATVPELNTV
ncbi:MAG: hypothetical protein IPJ33_13905 [Gammaproteobacteria bacterium]|nr:hypothetical protein [Gammaproteobacteria bacterium]